MNIDTETDENEKMKQKLIILASEKHRDALERKTREDIDKAIKKNE